ncbi:GIY-YIG nuclease family protein [Butyrivibrio sp. NC3005]|uniref:GIY-YIG nuclease family protein n=1 Tax=Butyrivibrio sp. NC3005 TaxID=1280685 RepID=UPI00040AEF1F|nr:GIY-YIG nuclease family protein [Butyrivibrio sp. NC3005]
MENHYPDYYKPLSCVKGIYMIIDGNTGKQYVGSAYGTEGIWGRWNTYALTCHGDDEELLKLYEANGEKYFDKYKFIILQILPMKISNKDVIDRETAYKKRFLTKDFGLNNN